LEEKRGNKKSLDPKDVLCISFGSGF